MQKYLAKIKSCIRQFKEFKVQQISWKKNKLADMKVEMVSDAEAVVPQGVQLWTLNASGTYEESNEINCVRLKVC